MTRYNEGDKVTFQRKICLPLDGDKEYTIIECIDVPHDQIEFNSRIPAEENETGVGHSQWVRINDEKKSLYSAAFFEPESH